MIGMDGRPIVTAPITEALHFISSDKPPVLEALDKFIEQGIGGVAEVTEAELEELKKKAALSGPSKPPPDVIGGPMRAQDTMSESLPPPAPPAGVVGSTMIPPAAEIADLKQRLVELEKDKLKAQEVPKADPKAHVPPAVGRRSKPHHTP